MHHKNIQPYGRCDHAHFHNNNVDNAPPDRVVPHASDEGEDEG